MQIESLIRLFGINACVMIVDDVYYNYNSTIGV